MNEICKKIRRNILWASKESGHGHIPTCFSIVEILYSLYSGMFLNSPERDIFVLSKGHAALALYCVLAEFEFFPMADVRTMGNFLSNFGCHADRLKIPGIEVSTGSLGHGIGVAVGIALAFKIQGSTRRVYTLIGDGESNEGTIWESVMVAVNLGLNNLTIIYDDNQSHSRGLQIHDPEAHFEGFGCDVVSVFGHDVAALNKAIDSCSYGVKVVVAHTVKGYGCETLVRDPYAWHRRTPNIEEYEGLVRELDEKSV
jgi:transketolase